MASNSQPKREKWLISLKSIFQAVAQSFLIKGKTNILYKKFNFTLAKALYDKKRTFAREFIIGDIAVFRTHVLRPGE